MKRKLLINLDHLLDLGGNKNPAGKRVRPIEVIDNMLASGSGNSPRRKCAKRKVRCPLRYSPQLTRVKPGCSSDKTSGVCPKCSVYVEGTADDNGVVCVKCEAYWHFNCAEVTQEILDSEWKGIEGY